MEGLVSPRCSMIKEYFRIQGIPQIFFGLNALKSIEMEIVDWVALMGAVLSWESVENNVPKRPFSNTNLRWMKMVFKLLPSQVMDRVLSRI